MRYQEIHFWITFFCIVQTMCTTSLMLAAIAHEQDGAAETNSSSNYTSQLEDISRIVKNDTYSTTSTMSRIVTSTEVSSGEHTLKETMSTLSVSVNATNETETSVFTSNFIGMATTGEELPQTKERISASILTSREMPEVSTPSSFIDLLTTTIASASTEQPDVCISDNCTSPDHCIFVKPNGCIRVREGDTEDSLFYTIMAPAESSLIYVEMGKEDEDVFLNSPITIQFNECGKTQATWVLSAGHQIGEQNYVSTGPILTLQITTVEHWTNFTLHYWELKFESVVERVDDSLDDGVLDPPTFDGVSYKPNTRRTYLLTASKTRWNESSVMMTLSFVDLNELAGDYLLLGAGKAPFAGPHPLIFSGQVSKSRDYYIASDDVYVVFASGSSQKTEKKGFHIEWKRSGTAITKPEDEPDEETITDSVIQSVGICFYNKSFIAEFNRTEDSDGPLLSFREKLASAANRYAKQKNIFLESMLTESSVIIFRVSAIIEPISGVMPEGGIYAMVTIVHQSDRKTAMFRRNQLEEIINILEDEDEKNRYSMLGFKVGHCPSNKSYFDWYLAAALLVVISSIVLLLVWIYSSLSRWRNFRRDKRFSNHAVNVRSKESIFPPRENEYVRINPRSIGPRVELTTCDGESITLNSDSADRCTLEHDDASERVIFDQGWIMKKRPSRKELPKSLKRNDENESKGSFLQTFSAPLPSSRNRSSGLLWTADIHMNRLLPPQNPQPADHEYDCLVFPSSIRLDTEESETRM